MKSFLNKKVCILFILLSLTTIDKFYGLLTITKDKQISNNEMKVQFIQIPISVNNIGLKSDLENDMLVFQPYSLKVINPLIQTTTFIKFEDLIIFDNFEVNFDINVQMKNIFGIADSDKNMNVRIVLQDMQNKFQHNWQTCRIIFSTDSIKNNLMGPISSNIMLSKCSDSSPNLSISIMYMNIFCFETINHTFIFDSSFSKNYQNFLFSIPLNTVRLYYYNIQTAVYKMIFFLNINNTNQLPFSNSNQNFLTNQVGTENNLKYSFLGFSKEGVILSDSPYNLTTSVLFTFLFEDIRDCLIETVDKKILFPNENPSEQANKCCIRMQVMQKDLSITSLILCSYTLNEYRCDLEINHILNKLYDKCPCKFIQNISYAFDNNVNINQILLNFSFLSQGYIYTKIYEFMVNQITFFKSYPTEKQTFIENKLIKMIQELGPSFKGFAKSIDNRDVLKILARFADMGDLQSSFPGSTMGTNILPSHSFNQISTTSQENLFCNPNIYQLCETHPRMRDCICAGFPLSQICVENYCYLHPNFYECSPAYCLQNPTDLEACKCKYNPYDTECKCKLNPLRKQCYCLKYPNSNYCLPGFCQNDSNNMMEIYCVCQNNQNAPECRPEYCHENKFDSRCKCLVNPDDKTCRCITYPNDPACRINNNNNNNINPRDLENLKLDPNRDSTPDFEEDQNNSISVADETSTGSNLGKNQIEMSKNSRRKPTINNINTLPASSKNNFRGVINRNNKNIPIGIYLPSVNQKKSNENRGIIFPNSSNQSKNTRSTIPIDKGNSPTDHIDQTDQKFQDPQRETICQNDDTFCICKEHPYYSKCVCLVHPAAEICNTSFCSDETNKNNYECNPLKNCLDPSELSNDECKCKQSFTEECKCKLNPFSKECFCWIYPQSYLCNSNNCEEDKESIYCKCNNISTDKECLPTFCPISPNSAECFCITNPLKDYCKCLNTPAVCNEQEINGSITQYKANFSKNNKKNEESSIKSNKNNSGVMHNNKFNSAPKGLMIPGINISSQSNLSNKSQEMIINRNPGESNMSSAQSPRAPVMNVPVISEDPEAEEQPNQQIKNNNINQGSGNGLVIPKPDNQSIEQPFNKGNINKINQNKSNSLITPSLDDQQSNNQTNNNESVDPNPVNSHMNKQPSLSKNNQSKNNTFKQAEFPSNNHQKDSSSNQSNANPMPQKIDLKEEDKHIITLYMNQTKFNNDMKAKLNQLIL